MSTDVLRLDSLRLAYGDQPVVEDVNLTVQSGEWVSILGPSGCGKSSILRSIAGFLLPHSGTIELFGQPALQPPHARGVGMVFQDFALFNHMTVHENIAFGLKGKPYQSERVDQLLKRCDLTKLSERYPAQLSGGQQQRVALARALAPQPKLLLLDEPFANLDAELRADLGAWCAEQIQSEEAAALLVTHDRREAMALSDQIAIVDEQPGRVLQVDQAKILYEQPNHQAVARMTGEALLVPARATDHRARSALGDHEVLADIEGSVTLVIRPEHMSLIPDESGPLIVEHSYFDAQQWKHRLRYDGQTVTVAQNERVNVKRLSLTTQAPLWAIAR